MSLAIPLISPNNLSIYPYGVYNDKNFTANADLDAISTWADSNVTGNDLTYIGTVKNPFISTERLNGYKVIECDAVDSRMQKTGLSLTDFTYSIVTKLSGTIVSGCRTIDFGLSLRHNSGGVYNIASVTTAISNSGFGSETSWSVVTVRKSGSSITVFVNGKIVLAFTNSDALYTTFAVFGNSSSYAVGVFNKIFIAEINAYSSALTDIEVLKNQRYLKFKYGL